MSFGLKYLDLKVTLQYPVRMDYSQFTPKIRHILDISGRSTRKHLLQYNLPNPVFVSDMDDNAYIHNLCSVLGILLPGRSLYNSILSSNHVPYSSLISKSQLLTFPGFSLESLNSMSYSLQDLLQYPKDWTFLYSNLYHL